MIRLQTSHSFIHFPPHRLASMIPKHFIFTPTRQSFIDYISLQLKEEEACKLCTIWAEELDKGACLEHSALPCVLDPHSSLALISKPSLALISETITLICSHSLIVTTAPFASVMVLDAVLPNYCPLSVPQTSITNNDTVNIGKYAHFISSD